MTVTDDQTAQQANPSTTPNVSTPAAPIHPTNSQVGNDTHSSPAVGGDDLRPGHSFSDTQGTDAGSDPIVGKEILRDLWTVAGGAA